VVGVWQGPFIVCPDQIGGHFYCSEITLSRRYYQANRPKGRTGVRGVQNIEDSTTSALKCTAKFISLHSVCTENLTAQNLFPGGEEYEILRFELLPYR
jgi:hypothetical protein